VCALVNCKMCKLVKRLSYLQSRICKSPVSPVSPVAYPNRVYSYSTRDNIICPSVSSFPTYVRISDLPLLGYEPSVLRRPQAIVTPCSLSVSNISEETAASFFTELHRIYLLTRTIHFNTLLVSPSWSSQWLSSPPAGTRCNSQ
jgi:hypothetical protein